MRPPNIIKKTLFERLAIWILARVDEEHDRVWDCRDVLGDGWVICKKETFQRMNGTG